MSDANRALIEREGVGITDAIPAFYPFSDPLGVLNRLMNAARAEGPQPPETAGEDEPVAWRWRHTPEVYGSAGTPGPWNDGKPRPHFPGEAWRYEIQPLYTRPTKQVGEPVAWMIKHPTPAREGHYWAKLRLAENPDDNSVDWEVVQVFDNNGEGDEAFMASVPGFQRSQRLDAFVWGPEVPKPSELGR